MFQTKVIEIIKTDILCSVNVFENRVVYEVMWRNAVDTDRPQMTAWRMPIACWITVATNTLRICNTPCFFTTTMVARTLPHVTLYAQHIAWLAYS
jgi:hypothetical protein